MRALRKACSLVTSADLVVGAALDEVVGDLGQPLLGQLAQVFDVHHAVHCAAPTRASSLFVSTVPRAASPGRRWSWRPPRPPRPSGRSRRRAGSPRTAAAHSSRHSRRGTRPAGATRPTVTEPWPRISTTVLSDSTLASASPSPALRTRRSLAGPATSRISNTGTSRPMNELMCQIGCSGVRRRRTGSPTANGCEPPPSTSGRAL